MSNLCATCQKPVTGDNSECYRCGKPVHHDPENYRNDTKCGSWDMDWWSNGAEEMNEYLCNACIKFVYGTDRSKTQGSHDDEARDNLADWLRLQRGTDEQ